MKRVIILLLLIFGSAKGLPAFLTENHTYAVTIGPFKLGEAWFDFHSPQTEEQPLSFEMEMTFSGVARYLTNNHSYRVQGRLTRPNDVIDSFYVGEVGGGSPLKEISVVTNDKEETDYRYYLRGLLLRHRGLTIAEQRDLLSLGHFVQTLERHEFSARGNLVYGENGLEFWRLEEVRQEPVVFNGQALSCWVLKPKFNNENMPFLKELTGVVDVKVSPVVKIFNLNNQALIWLAEDGSIPKMVIGPVIFNRVMKN